MLYRSPSALKMQEYLRKMMRDGILDDTGWMETCIDDAGWYAQVVILPYRTSLPIRIEPSHVPHLRCPDCYPSLR